jgi:menaquinone-dependent protoporphyrinogen IX oxidase
MKESMKMKGIVVYDTSYGNSKEIAETIAETLKESEIEVDLFYVKKVKLYGKDYDFIIVGSPTKWGTMSFTMKRFLGKIKSEEWANKPFAAFDTELPDNIEKTETEGKDWSAAEKIAEKLTEKNLKQIIPVLKAVVLGKKGPLKDGEIERTKDYTKELVIKLTKEK